MKFLNNENYILNLTIFSIKSKAYCNQGFVFLYFIFFLSLLSLFIFAFGFIFFASQSKDAFRKSCATLAVNLQKEMIRDEKRILLLNFPSTALRIRMTALQTQFVATPPPANAAIAIAIAQTLQQQKKLDLTQKTLILNANLAAAAKYTQLFIEIQKQNTLIAARWSDYLQIFSVIVPAAPPRLSLRPDSPFGLAPNYEFSSDLVEQQKVRLYWQNWFWLQSKVKHIFSLPGLEDKQLIVNRFALICTIEPKKENLKWSVKINLDKP